MRKSIKSGIAAAAVAASALGAGAGVAAAVAGPASAATVSVVKPAVNPTLNAWNQMTLAFNGGTAAGYWVLLQSRRGGLLTGWLYDPNLPVGSRYLAAHGVVIGSGVLFGATYPSGFGQGTRAFNGTIGSTGILSGVWNETGSEGLSGTFTFH
jgi:hypothetical protein